MCFPTQAQPTMGENLVVSLCWAFYLWASLGGVDPLTQLIRHELILIFLIGRAVLGP